MNSRSITATLFIIMAIWAVSVPPTSAQQRTSTQNIAVLDVEKVFKQNQGFIAKMELFNADKNNLDTLVKQQMAELNREARGLSQYEIGSQQRNTIESNLLQLEAKIRTEARQTELQITRNEARAYYDLYQKMQSALASIVAQRGISLVLKRDSTPIAPTDLNSVKRGISRSVVFESGHDITPLVIEQLAFADSQTATPPGTANNRR